VNCDNSNYAGGSTGFNVSVPVGNASLGVYGSVSSGGLTGNPLATNAPIVVGGNVSMGALGHVTGGLTLTNSKSVNLGKYWTFAANPFDAANYAARQLCNRGVQ